MPSKPSPDSLIHCAVCGEDYSATYRRCPFCGAKNGPAPAQAPAGRGREPEDDGYVFDGQDLFDDGEEDDYRPARPKGGKRLADKSGGGFDLSAVPVNWPRMITFVCSLIIIVAALIIVFTVIYPQLHGQNPPAADSNPPASEPVAPPSLPVAPNTDPVAPNTQPVEPPPSQPVEPNAGALTSITLNKDDITMRPDAGYNVFQLVPTFTPANWAGTVTWTSSDETLAKVAADGTVTYVAQNITSVRLVMITAHAGDLEASCKVYIAGPRNPNTPSPNPDTTNPPAVATNPPSGGVTVGRSGVIVNAEGGLRVRSGPGTTYEILATLLNGNTVQVLSDEGNGWYRISYAGAGGQATMGYIMGDYISTN